MKLKNTVYTPFTNFPMRANAQKREPELTKFWEENKIYQKMLHQNKNHPTYYIHHGPAYANGDIHVGHCLNIFLKEFVQRIKLQAGYYAPIMFGWDTHGLPIEHALLKKNKELVKLPSSEFRNKCREYAKKQIHNQMNALKRLGLAIDFNQYYVTMDKGYEADEANILFQLLLNNYIYRANKPIIWSWSSRSALAEAEVEYRDYVSPSIFVKCKITNGKNFLDNAFLLIWTTTPWTLPSNKLIAYNKQFTYLLTKNKNDERIILSKESFLRINNKLDLEIISELSANQLQGLQYESPITKEICLVVEGHHVLEEQGTGLVHCAPGHGKDDYIIGLKHKIKIISGVNEKGLMIDKKYYGMFYSKANLQIIEDLKKDKLLLINDQIEHSYPMDWRTKKPIIYRATTQWFIDVNKIKEALGKFVKATKWYQPWAEKKMYDMVVKRDDWCISRQRKWGVPIAIYYDKKGEPIIDKILFTKIVSLFRTYGSDIYYEKQFEDLLMLENDHIKDIFKKKVTNKELDILDVWLDSGISHHAIMYKKFNVLKSDLYAEGKDQFRGWFNSSLITSVMLNDDAPFKSVLTHGFIVDKLGRKMSKSLGNGIPLDNIIKQYGTDTLRLLYANSDYSDDVKLGHDIMQQLANQYRKLRNTFRFLLSNLDNFHENDYVKNFKNIDIYELNNLNKLIHHVTRAYGKFNFKSAIKAIVNYVTNLSSIYFEIAKDILYINDEEDLRKKQIKTVFAIIVSKLLRLIAPILPFLAEDVYQNTNFQLDKQESVHLLKQPKLIKLKANAITQSNKIVDLLILKEDFNHFIDEKIKQGIIKKGAQVICQIEKSDLLKVITKEEIKEILQCAYVDIKDHLERTLKINSKYNFDIVIDKNLIKCDRCWQFFKKEEIVTIKKGDYNYNIDHKCLQTLNKNFPLWE